MKADRILVLCVLTIGLAGCGQSRAPAPTQAPTVAPTATVSVHPNPPGSSGNTTGRDSCSLLTKDEASQVLAQPVTEVTVEFGTCFYRAANQTYVGVVVFWSGGVTLLKTDREMFPDAQQVPGLGDEALYARDGQLEVRKGDAAFTISSTIAVTPDKLDKLKVAAVKMVSRLP